MKKSLAEIATDAMMIERMLLDEEYSATHPVLEGILNQVETQLEHKADAYDFLIQRCSKMADIFEEKSVQFDNVARRFNNLRERLKGKIKETMIALDRKEITGENVVFKLTKSQPSVDILSPNIVPAKYIRLEQVTHIEKNAIKEDLKNGVPVPGCALRETHALRVGVPSIRGLLENGQ